MKAGQLRHLGPSPVSVTQYGLGGTALGNIYTAVEEQAALDTIHAAYGAGVRYFDTAPLYGSGLSEIRLGKGLARYHRDAVVISSKVGWALEPRPPGQEAAMDLFDKALPYRGVVDYSADAIKRSLEDSLSRLNTDRIDIVANARPRRGQHSQRARPVCRQPFYPSHGRSLSDSRRSAQPGRDQGAWSWHEPVTDVGRFCPSRRF